MRQQLASQAGPFRNDLIGTAQWYQFGTDWHPVPLDQDRFDTAASDVTKGLGKAVPVTAGTWAGLTTSQYQATSQHQAPANFAGLEWPTRLEVIYRTSLTSYTRLVAGTLSGSAVPHGLLGVSVTAQTASRFHLHPGSTVRMDGSGGLLAVKLYVTGIVSVRQPDAPFWLADTLAAGPVLQAPIKGPPPYWEGALLTDPGQLLSMQDIFCPYPGQVSCDSMSLRWEVPMDLNAFSADQAQALANDITTATSGATLSSTLGPGASDITVSGPAAQTLATFIDTQASIMAVLLLLLVSLIAIGLAVLALAARLIVAQREDELRMLRARGATVRQLARRVLAGTALAVIPGTVAGALLALIPIRLSHAPVSAGWRLAIVAPLVALFAPPLLAAWRHRKAEPSAVNPAVILTAETRAARYSLAAKRRIVAGGTLCAAAVAVLLLLHQEGLPAAGSVNWILTIAPVMLAVPAALLAMRLYPLVVRLLLNQVIDRWRRVTATGYVALASSTRLPVTLAAYTLVLALTLAAFCGMVSGGISQGQIAASWQAAAGADATVTVPSPGELTPAVQRQIAAVPGVRHSAAVSTTAWSLPDGAQFTLIQVNPAQYAALTADTPFPPIPASALTAAGPGIPVLASPQVAAEIGGHVTEIEGQQEVEGHIQIRLAGTLTEIPAQPANGQFVLMAARTLPVTGLAQGPNLLLITGDVNQAALTATLNRVLPAATVTFRAAVLDSLTGAPLVHAAAVLMTLSVIACSVLAVLGLLLGLTLGARDREQTLARLAVMGNQRDIRFALVCIAPALLGAAAAAIACTLALPALVGSAINLSVFTGSGAPVSFRPDLMALCLPGAAIVILATATLITQTRRSRRDVPGLLRVG